MVEYGLNEKTKLECILFIENDIRHKFLDKSAPPLSCKKSEFYDLEKINHRRKK